MKISKLLLLLTLIGFMGTIVSCSDDDDDHDHDHEGEEFIDEVILTFTPTDTDLATVTARWFDADGDGAGSGEVTQGIELIEGAEYILTMTMNNSVSGENITEEIVMEAAEHQIFFEFTNDIFSNPTGNGNIDNRDDAVNYNDFDSNQLPVGINTTWTTGSIQNGGSFRILLKHQPDEKSATSTSSTGGTDLDITFPLNVM